MKTITGVPAESVGQVTQDFINDGAQRVVVERDDNGTFTVSAA